MDFPAIQPRSTMPGGPTDTQTLIAELATLQRDEVHLSALRRRLHEQIDRGFPNDIVLRREKKVSADRRELHRRIDALRASL
jgi:hypothetical protein